MSAQFLVLHGILAEDIYIQNFRRITAKAPQRVFYNIILTILVKIW